MPFIIFEISITSHFEAQLAIYWFPTGDFFNYTSCCPRMGSRICESARWWVKIKIRGWSFVPPKMVWGIAQNSRNGMA